MELVQGAVPSEVSDTPVAHELITAGRRCAVIGKGTVWTVWEKLEKITMKKNIHVAWLDSRALENKLVCLNCRSCVDFL